MTDKRRKGRKVNNEAGSKKHRRLKSEFKRATHKPKKEYLESLCDDVIEFQIRSYDNVHEDKGTRLERKARDSKHWH
jgi:hypothetical protein